MQDDLKKIENGKQPKKCLKIEDEIKKIENGR